MFDLSNNYNNILLITHCREDSNVFIYLHSVAIFTKHNYTKPYKILYLINIYKNVYSHPSTSFTNIVRTFRKISGTATKKQQSTTTHNLKTSNLLLATVLMECIRFKICAFAVGCSPNPCTDGLFALQPTESARIRQNHSKQVRLWYLLFARKRSSWRIQIAFKHKREASNKFQRVKAIVVCCFGFLLC